MTPVLSLITGTRNRPEEFRRLVRSIEQFTPMPWELVVSDASDEPFNPDYFTGNVVIIPEKPRRGCTIGYNTAFNYALGKWCLWLNDDCEVTAGYAEKAIEFMEAHPEIGLGALYYSDPNHSGWKVNKCSFGMDYANFGIIRRSFGDKVGWFDEDFTMYGNDNSLAYRVLIHGKGIAAIPNAFIVHHSKQDKEREENNDLGFRIAQADLLKAKYAVFLPYMRAVYERCRMVTA